MDELNELELELKKLRPQPVSGRLMVRLEKALIEPQAIPTAGMLKREPKRTYVSWLLGLGLTAAAAVVIIGLIFFEEPLRTQPRVTQNSPMPAARLTTGLRPDALTQVIYHRQDEGLVFSPNRPERPLRRVRYETRETVQWRDPRTGASLRVSYPAEQVVMTPVSFQ